MFYENDVENILKASYHISNMNVKQSNEGFKRELLQTLSQHLDYHHMLFWELSNNELSAPVLFNIEGHTINDYLQSYKHLDPLHPQNINSQHSIHLMTKNEIMCPQKQTHYKEVFLKENRYEDEMAMYLKVDNKPVAVIGFLRKLGEKLFNEKDMLKLVYLKRNIENMYSLHHYSQPSILFEMTERERDVLNFVFKGLKNGEIAQQLFVSENTIKKHLQNLYRKFQVTNRTQLLAKCLKYIDHV
ncbi:LuxR C-terminal-related transcriptional regulator [Lysinibacillus irui]|uniref:LuxR C-terminal-related transcriptional regulator n=1 Tax=Lysinibacillus irui TaxID=2998077 RepID=A0AAJ5RMV9_9BACI|nr:LuxR C-terminal-related transcriptional regulator [Lysinibacillus irui]MEA0553556.1 LuxR C-terminal-related transcriptional regulator [Lysinibacillus irui]MEA0975940.1 LuxR C-terminal-related transcriptional regulator [Lysinibacillus irui]MEA1042094.1 LuxR C-terminal-related transcriptional regulator [Lysinibacillus irui]WDV06138.1 LuxR C-terminal-related transcriptional regulator [Lysinibacillus irui]